ncbi:hypothetical protein M404DRAFT_995269 [Pisolithus tinctorius Marx 270]|uniref:Uncharacterized protein n=1 Tax=Pisolithus tinctorius Marx 270 TaxID=870435 RepID=A0A0C3PAY2_PISTI|nr:hypothetical protein M404DRAFT_995269 [Pisolithus tinctorius Marx 270]
MDPFQLLHLTGGDLSPKHDAEREDWASGSAIIYWCGCVTRTQLSRTCCSKRRGRHRVSITGEVALLPRQSCNHRPIALVCTFWTTLLF